MGFANADSRADCWASANAEASANKRLSFCILMFLDTVQIVRGAYEYLIPHGYRAGQRMTVQLVDSENFEFRSCLYNRGRAFFIHVIELALGKQRGRTVGSIFDPLSFVGRLTGYCIQ